MLQHFTHSNRPRELKEVVELVPRSPEEHPQYESRKRLNDPRNVLNLCSNLVTTSLTKTIEGDSETVESEEDRHTEFSIEEHLVSERMESGPISL